MKCHRTGRLTYRVGDVRYEGHVLQVVARIGAGDPVIAGVALSTCRAAESCGDGGA